MDSWNKDRGTSMWQIDSQEAESVVLFFATGGVGFQLCFACKYFGCFQASIIQGSLNYPVGGMKQCKCMVILKNMSLIIVPLFGLVMTFVIRALFGWLCLDTRHLQPRQKHIAIAEKSGEKRRAEFTKAQSDQCKLLVRFM